MPRILPNRRELVKRSDCRDARGPRLCLEPCRCKSPQAALPTIQNTLAGAGSCRFVDVLGRSVGDLVPACFRCRVRVEIDAQLGRALEGASGQVNEARSPGAVIAQRGAASLAKQPLSV